MDENSKVGTERVRDRTGEPITSEARCLESGNQLGITLKKKKKKKTSKEKWEQNASMRPSWRR